MGRNPTERTPDLFSAGAVGDTPAPPKLPGTEAATEIASQRHVLPKNLRNAVKHLSDGELDLMYAATLEEMKRRGRIPRGVEAVSHAGPDSTKPEPAPTEKRRHANAAEAPLTRGQLNLVRAAFKTGVTPSRIARQFGISQSNVRKALSPDETKR
jgi:hypothetical protein